MKCPKAVLFDLDDTLAPSFEPPSQKIIERLLALLHVMPVAIVTGRDFEWMNRQFLPRITASLHIERFFVMSEGAAQCLVFADGQWKELYGDSLEEADRDRVTRAITESVRETHVLEEMPVFGEQFVHRKAAVAFAALGWSVPRDLRYTWDPGNVRRTALRDAIVKKLPEFDVLMGGTTTIDVTKKGVNKSHGVRWLAGYLGIPVKDTLYIGDTLFPGGNDYVVIETGIQTRTTSGPDETLKIMDQLLAACV